MSSGASQRRYAALCRMVNRKLSAVIGDVAPDDIRAALQHVVRSGGKRVRSTLLLLSCQAVGGRIRDALNAAAAIELMHDFTLVHDDIMDNAPTRRGRPSVHKQWGLSRGVLAGDVLIGLAVESFLRTKRSDLVRLTEMFNRGLLDVCEGQGLDLAFGNRSDVSLLEYFTMIDKKTAALLSTSTMIGGIIGSGNDRHVEALRRFGRHLGRAFQVQDDLLDVVAAEKKFGKSVGGDIIEGKKTFLLVKAIETARGRDRAVLASVAARGTTGARSVKSTQTIKRISGLYHKLGILDAARGRILAETREATRALSELPRNDGTSMLYWFSDLLLRRAF